MAYKNPEENRIKVCKAYRELKNKDMEYLNNLEDMRKEYFEQLTQLKNNLIQKYPNEFKYLSRSLEFCPSRLSKVIKFLKKGKS